ncbi:hypothetical protein FUAX_45010 (plasmid) [Fulvitalea axinellae]|uniref:Uncharacterized protein n=1 Tax=Fulvitalea axinellae TaxID=1182444 RepID=A0AAU9CZY7_9BACT|nr:hypothetical protein FUAX_45010 [Fulvitalea axinellae]
MDKVLCTTMYNRNYGRFDYPSTPLGIADVSSKPKINAY